MTDTLQTKLAALYMRRSRVVGDQDARAKALDVLLNDLGNPHLHLPPVIHAAGTNGKGSTLAMIRAMLEAQNFCVHVYTSPHLMRFNERIVVSGREIEDAELENLLDHVTEKAGELPLAFFDLVTAMGFLAFARTPADYTLLETGMGGRLDPTNLVPDPACTLITPIGLDHTEFLGSDLERIAGEKAGIIKPGCPCVVARQTERAVYDVFIRQAAELEAPLYLYDREWRVEPREPGFRFEKGAFVHNFPLPSLAGHHQIDNAGTALAVLSVLKRTEDEKALSTGLQSCHWPARMQYLGQNRGGAAIWLDGGHNEDAARVLVGQLQTWKEQQPNQPLYLALAYADHRAEHAAAFLKTLAESPVDAVLVPDMGAEGQTYIAARTLAGLAEKAGFKDVRVTDTLRAFLEIAPAGKVLVAGSLYLAGEVLALGDLQKVA